MSPGPDDDRPISVPSDSDLGSPRLAAALAAGDSDAIGRALREDVVVVPLTRGANGRLDIRIFEPAGGRPQLALFSSVATLVAFLADDPQRDFDVRRGTDFGPFLAQYHELIERVVLDPAGPHPVAATPDAVIAALAPRSDDDDVDWITGV